MGRKRYARIEHQQTTTTTGGHGGAEIQRADGPGQAFAAVMAGMATPGSILALQRTIGNAAVNQLLRQQAAIASVHHTLMPAAFGPSVQRHTEGDQGIGHICSAACRHAVQRTTAESLPPTAPIGSAREMHVCGPECRHAGEYGLGQATVMRATAQAPTSAMPRIPLRRTAGRPLAVQRHSSFEHKMLGDVSPEDLKVLAAAANLDKKSGMALEKYGNGGAKEIRGPNGVIRKENVLHVLNQEIRRLNYFKNAAVRPDGTPMSGQEFQEHLRKQDKKDRMQSRLDEEGLSFGQARARIATPQGAQLKQDLTEINNNEWQVRIVSLPSQGGAAPLLISYGEMNTLADLYGSPQELIQADPTNRYEIVQGIRQQSIIKFLDMLREVEGANIVKKKFGMHLGEGFDDAIGSTGRGNGPLPMGELRLMGKIPGATGKQTGSADTSQSYVGGLARNACHFAPESWHSWADYHDKGRRLAASAYALRNPPNAVQPSQADLATADERENGALIYNGFGDHFLQDSYAAGHLINKTQIMLWLVKWLDAHPYQSDKETASEWRRIQPMAYNQPGLGVEANRYDASQVGTIKAKDPQSVENMKDPGGDAVQGRKDRFAALGLRIPSSLTPGDPAFDFLVAWQQAAATNEKQRTMTVDKAIARGFARDYVVASIAFKRLVADDVARVDGKGVKRQDLSAYTFTKIGKMSFVLNGDYVPKDATAFGALRADLGSANAGTKANAEQEYATKATNVTYAQFHKFLNSTLLQASSNVLHDHFCKNGVEVETGSGESLGRIYGDDAMLGKDSAKGVEYSGVTARTSRQAIFDLIEYGPNNAGHPIPAITDISKRFPTKAKLDNGSYGSLDQWHTDLEQLCNNTIFPDMKGKVTGSIKNIAATVSPEVSPKVSKDVHPGADVF